MPPFADRMTRRLGAYRHHPLVRKARKAARLGLEDPQEFTRLVGRRLRQQARSAVSRPGGRHTKTSGGWQPGTWEPTPLLVGHRWSEPADWGYLVFERRRGYADGTLVLGLALEDEQGALIKPGRDWKRSAQRNEHYSYLPATGDATVSVPFTTSGVGAVRARVTVRRAADGGMEPAQILGSSWLLWSGVRHTGAAEPQLSLAALAPWDGGPTG